MIFGVWPGVVPADLVTFEPLECPAEDQAQTLAAIKELQGSALQFWVRAFRHYAPGGPPHAGAVPSPVDPGCYVGNGRRVDLVCSYQSPVPYPGGFARFIRRAVQDLHRWGGGKIQIGEEANMGAPQDGGSPGWLSAIAAGVVAAVDERERLEADVQIGVNSAGPADEEFWRLLARFLGDAVNGLDYLGLDMFPDVFFPVPHDSLPNATRWLVHAFREHTSAAGFPSDLPIHIGETGWPTGPERSEQRQAVILRTVAETVLTSDEGVEAYEVFGLRDTITTGPWQTQFGLLRDDYTQKPAFGELQQLIAASR